MQFYENKRNEKKPKKSFTQYGTLNISLEKALYSTGDQVNGVINLDLVQDFPSSKIILKIIGKEKTRYWKEYTTESTGINGDTVYHNYTCPKDNAHKCFDFEFPAASFPGNTVPAGQYQIPFSFKLPKNTPSSFYHEWHKLGLCYAKIYYTAKVKLERKVTNKSFENQCLLKHKTTIIVNASQFTAVIGQKVPLDKEVVSDCCIRKGDFKMIAYFEKNAYKPNETAYLVIEAANETTVKCKQIYGNFIQEIEFLNMIGEYGNKTVLQTVKINGMEPGERWSGEDAKRIQIPLTGIRISSGANRGAMNTSVRGSIVRCTYYISVQTDMEADIYCDEHPSTRIPINLYNESPPVTGAFVEPPNWYPKVLDAYNVEWRPEFKVQSAESALVN